MDFDAYYSTTEVSQMLGIDIRSVSRIARKGDIEGVKIGRQWFLLKTSVEAYRQSIEGLDKHDPTRGKQKNE